MSGYGHNEDDDDDDCIINKTRRNTNMNEHQEGTSSVSASTFDSSSSSASSWACVRCTYEHKPPNEHIFLVCALCGTPKEDKEPKTTSVNKRKFPQPLQVPQTKKKKRILPVSTPAVKSAQSTLNWHIGTSPLSPPSLPTTTTIAAAASKSVSIKEATTGSPLLLFDNKRLKIARTPSRRAASTATKSSILKSSSNESMTSNTKKEKSKPVRSLLDVLKPQPASSFVPRIRYRYIQHGNNLSSKDSSAKRQHHDGIINVIDYEDHQNQSNQWKEISDEDFSQSFSSSSKCPIIILRDVLPKDLADELFQELEEESTNW